MSKLAEAAQAIQHLLPHPDDVADPDDAHALRVFNAIVQIHAAIKADRWRGKPGSHLAGPLLPCARFWVRDCEPGACPLNRPGGCEVCEEGFPF